MTSALDLLMDSDSTAETTTLLESNGICTIDSRTRTIFVPPEIIVGAVQSDKNAERIKFSCPKIVGDNLDLSKFSIRINFENVSIVDPDISIKDQYICEDASINGDNITFSWVIGKNAARYMGIIRFIVCAVKTDSDSNISIEWNTTVAQIPVLEGIEVDQPSLDENNKDVINQLLAITKTASDEAVKNVNSAKEQAITDIQNVSQPDKTLTVEGGIADAKATGNAISSLREDLGDFNGLGSFNNATKILEFGYVNELGQYSVTQTKQNMFMPLIHCAPGYKFVFTNPLDMDAWLSIHLYSAELLYKGKISEVLCEKKKTVSYAVEEECFIRARVAKRYATASTDEELSEVQKNFYVSNVDWLSPPVEKYDNSLKIDINTFAYYRKIVERKTGDFTFCYQTDTHYSQSGTYKTLDNLKNLVNVDRSILPNFCSNLGDVTHGYLNHAVGMDDYMKAMSVYKKIRTFLPVQGNHENNTLYTFQHTQNRSIKEIVQKSWFYDSTFNPFCVKNNGVIDENKLYYSVDFDNIKVIVLDTNDLPETEVNSSGQLIFASGYQAGIRQEQLDWLIDTLKMPKPKYVIVLSHHSLSAGTNEDTNVVYNANAVRGILEAYNSNGTFTLEQNPYGGEYFKISVNCDFTGAKEYKGANVIGCFAGHTHADAMYTINNIHYVVSDSSVPDTSENKEARKSDATSDVIETVKIDTSKKEVNIIRFGYGIGVKDRSFTY